MRTVYACSLRFPGHHASDSVWREIATWVESWYGRNAPGVTLPAGWSDGAAGKLTPVQEHSLEAVTLRLGADSEGPLRELRWQYPDTKDAGLAWSAEATVHVSTDTFFTIVLRMTSVDYQVMPAKFLLGTPRIVRMLVERDDAHIGEHPVHVAPQHVDPASVEGLVDFLMSKTRRHPVIVLSPDAHNDVLMVDPMAISAGLAGVASVHALSSKWAGFALTDEVGKRLSCYNGAARIYWPRFALDGDSYFHRLWLPTEICECGGTEGLTRNLLRVVASAASFRFVEPEPVRAFRLAFEQVRIATLKSAKGGDYDALFDEYVTLDRDARELRGKFEEVTRENETLRENLVAILSASSEVVESSPNASAVDDRPDLQTVHDAVTEAQHRTTHLTYLEDAFTSAHESPFKQPDKAYSALLAIDDVARGWAQQLDGGPKAGPRKEAFRQRGFEYKDDISQTSGSRWGDEYSYMYQNKKVLFAPHITIGAKQADKCLSIHMHWDEATRRVVIAHVGRHKTNTRA